MSGISRFFRDLRSYPSAIAGGVIIIGFLLVGVYALITIPYDEAVRLWRGGEEVWYNWFAERDLPETITLNSANGDGEKTVTQNGDLTDVVIQYSFDYPYSGFPQELSLYVKARYVEKAPFISMTWITPDGREIRLGDVTPEGSTGTFRFNQDERLKRRLRGLAAEVGLFLADGDESADPFPVQGTYQLRVSATLFEPDNDVDAEFILYGQVHGLAGTDHRRRDLMVALLWGTPIALAFGLVAALGTTLSTMTIAAISTWSGGFVDNLIQRVTEVNLILPLLPILIMVGTFYSRSIWLMLGLIILLSIFGGAIKTYRAIFLQVKESAYIEAARAYGAGGSRIIFVYLIPRIIPILIPNLVNLVPAFVFTEATLAVLGLGDPVLPTWGKVINDANGNGALFNGYYYWVLEPALLLMLAGLAFAMVGFALDRVFNPRLRGI